MYGLRALMIGFCVMTGPVWAKGPKAPSILEDVLAQIVATQLDKSATIFLNIAENHENIGVSGSIYSHSVDPLQPDISAAVSQTTRPQSAIYGSLKTNTFGALNTGNILSGQAETSGGSLGTVAESDQQIYAGNFSVNSTGVSSKIVMNYDLPEGSAGTVATMAVGAFNSGSSTLHPALGF